MMIHNNCRNIRKNNDHDWEHKRIDQDGEGDDHD